MIREKITKEKTICFVAGKSGGHIIPAITLAKSTIAKNKKSKILFFTTTDELDKKIIKKSELKSIHISLTLGNIPHKKILQYPKFFTNLTYSFVKSFLVLTKNRPQKIISLGGLVSLPVCIAAFLLRIPIELFELNATPGKAIKFLSYFANTINICFASAISYLPKQKCKLTQYPMRFTTNQPTTLKKHTFSKSKFTILVLGGSQGSLAINNAIKKIVTKNTPLKNKIQLIHQTGDLDKTDWMAFYKKNATQALAFNFDSNLKEYYKLADLVICRSGAGALFETLFFKKKCITIPLETPNTSHQVDNAKQMQKTYPQMIYMIKQENIDYLEQEITKSIDSKTLS